MKIIILAINYGYRLLKCTKTILKPIVKVLGKATILRIIDYYILYEHCEFYIAIGYKDKELKKLV